MTQLNPGLISPPPIKSSSEIPILSLLKEAYLLWHSYLVHLPKLTRHTLGVKIDTIFSELLAMVVTAQYTKHEDKKIVLEAISRTLDTLKFFVTLLWETKGLNGNKYSQLAQKLASAGRMLGKWFQKLSEP